MFKNKFSFTNMTWQRDSKRSKYHKTECRHKNHRTFWQICINNTVSFGNRSKDQQWPDEVCLNQDMDVRDESLIVVWNVFQSFVAEKLKASQLKTVKGLGVVSLINSLDYMWLELWETTDKEESDSGSMGSSQWWSRRVEDHPSSL